MPPCLQFTLSAMLFREISEAAPDTIVVICEGRMVYANPAAVRVV